MQSHLEPLFTICDDFSCFVSRLTSAAHRRGKFCRSSKSLCMMVGNVHDSTTACKVWERKSTSRGEKIDAP